MFHKTIKFEQNSPKLLYIDDHSATNNSIMTEYDAYQRRIASSQTSAAPIGERASTADSMPPGMTGGTADGTATGPTHRPAVGHQATERNITVSTAKRHEHMVVTDIALDDRHAFRLAELGIRPGMTVRVVQRTGFGGRVLACGTARIALDRDTAAHIFVAPVRPTGSDANQETSHAPSQDAGLTSRSTSHNATYNTKKPTKSANPANTTNTRIDV